MEWGYGNHAAVSPLTFGGCRHLNDNQLTKLPQSIANAMSAGVFPKLRVDWASAAAGTPLICDGGRYLNNNLLTELPESIGEMTLSEL